MGFLAHATWLKDKIATNTLPANIKSVGDANRMIFNDYVNVAVTAFFMVSVIVILADSIRVWLSFKSDNAEITPPMDPLGMSARATAGTAT
jgi:carbon starvation protein